MFMKHNENNKVDKIMLFHQALGKASQPRMNCHGTLQSTDYTMACRVTNNKGSRAPLDAAVYVKSQLPTGKLQGFLAATAKKGRIRKDRRCFSFPALGEAVTVPSWLGKFITPRRAEGRQAKQDSPLSAHEVQVGVCQSRSTTHIITPTPRSFTTRSGETRATAEGR